AVCLEPQVEHSLVERGDRWRVFANRRVRDQDVVVGDPASGEEVEILLRIVGWIAYRQRVHLDFVRHQHACGALDSGRGPRTMEGSAMDVMDMRRPIQTDSDLHLVRLEALKPRFVDENAVGGHRDWQLAARACGNGVAALGNAMKVLDAPEQRLAAV